MSDAAPLVFGEQIEEAAFLRSLLEVTPDLVYLYDLEARANVFANRQLGDLLGYGPEDVAGEAVNELFHPDDVEAIVAHHAAMRREPRGGTRSLTYRALHREGTWRWLRSRDTAFAEREGATRLILGVCQDVTEDRAREDELREREALYRMLTEHSRELVCRHARDGTYEYVSPACTQLLGYAPEALIGRNPYDLFHPDDRSRIERGSHEMAKEGVRPAGVIYRIRHAQGHWVWLETMTEPLLDAEGCVEKLLTTSRDVTQRMRAATDVANERALLEAIFDALPDPTLVVDPQRRVVRLSRSVTTAFGYEPGELLGRTTERLYADPDSFAKTGRRYFHPTVKQTSASYAERYRRASGEEFDGEASAGVVRGGDGQVLGYLGIIRDVSERVEMLRELERANAELEQFAYVASHDLQAPLRTIAGFSELLEEDHGDALGPEGRAHLARIRAGATRMRQLIVSLLAYSRAGKHTTPVAPVDLGAVLHSAAADLEAARAEANATFTLPAAGEVPRVLGEETGLRQVFRNLFDNALKFRRADVPCAIAVRVDATHKARVVVEVHDNGVGIPEPDLVRIFKVFQRLHTRGEVPGDGIGLALVRRIVERHGGEVSVASTLGEGTAFSIRLRRPA